MLKLEAIHTYYGNSHILQGVDLEVGEGETVTLLGRNGAGKTTTLRSIMGLTPARAGRIVFAGQDITRAPTHRIARAGLAFVPSGRRIFSELTVRENLLLFLRQPQGRAPAWDLDHVYEVFPKLAELDARKAGFLSGGEQQMLKLGRALVANPRMLLLDELTEGLAPDIVNDLGDWLRRLKSEGFSILICGSASELSGSGEIMQYLGV